MLCLCMCLCMCLCIGLCMYPCLFQPLWHIRLFHPSFFFFCVFFLLCPLLASILSFSSLSPSMAFTLFLLFPFFPFLPFFHSLFTPSLLSHFSSTYRPFHFPHHASPRLNTPQHASTRRLTRLPVLSQKLLSPLRSSSPLYLFLTIVINNNNNISNTRA